MANIPAHLLLVAATRQVSHAHCRPPEFNHHGDKVPISTHGTLALWHPEYIDQFWILIARAVEPFHLLRPLSRYFDCWLICGLGDGQGATTRRWAGPSHCRVKWQSGGPAIAAFGIDTYWISGRQPQRRSKRIIGGHFASQRPCALSGSISRVIRSLTRPFV